MIVEKERFDIAFKYLYAQSVLQGGSDFFLEAYKVHLEVLNGFEEEHKTCFEDYVRDFEYLIQDVQKVGIRGPIAKNQGRIVNGAHRVALSLLFDIELPTIETKYHPFNLDYSFFGEVPLKYKDAAAIAVAEKLNPNTRIAVVFPGAINAYQTLQNFDIYYHKRVWIAKPINLTKALYHTQSWADHEGTTHKANACFPSGSGWVDVYLIDFEGEEVAAKTEVRERSKISNHSIHITDTNEETIDICRVLFNENSLHFLNNSEYKGFPNFEKWLPEFSVPNSAISGSAILSAYGLRDCRDLDYICIHEDAHSHNDHTKDLYPVSRFEIISSPDYHFWHRGKRFVSLELAKIMKQNRNEPKDIDDLCRL